MPIKNFTTTVPVQKSLGEIVGALARAGVQAVQTEFGTGGRPVGIAFKLAVGSSPFFYQLPARPAGVHATLKRDRAPARYLEQDQVERIAWRILRDWVLAQLALVDAGSADLAEVFMPYVLVGPQTTAYGRFRANVAAGLLVAGDVTLHPDRG